MRDYSNKKTAGEMFILGALTAALVGGYYLFGSKNARRNRLKVEWWIEDAKSEVQSKMRQVKNLSREKFEDIVDEVSDKYARLKNLKDEKLRKLKSELRRRWDETEYEDVEY